MCSQPKQRPAHIPMRTCAGCGEQGERRALIRVVCAEGQLTVDKHRTLSGRGAWVHPAPTCIAQAKRRRTLSRILRVNAATLASADLTAFWDSLERVALSEAPRVPERE